MFSELERDGKNYRYVNGRREEFIVPQFSEILQAVYNKIHRAGFVKIEHCNPQNANCIIRVYQNLHCRFNFGTYYMYGADCFTNENGVWLTESYSKRPIALKYDHYEVFKFVIAEEKIKVKFKTEFMDCYVRIS